MKMAEAAFLKVKDLYSMDAIAKRYQFFMKRPTKLGNDRAFEQNAYQILQTYCIF